MRKLTILVSVLLMSGIFLFIMGSGSFLKKPLTTNDDVIGQIHRIQEAINKEAWGEVELQLTGLESSWEKVKNRIQFSVERDSLEALDAELGELKGAILIKDKKTAKITLEKIVNLWTNMG